MPRIFCRSCGRELYATAPLASLFADERRCPRCGATLETDNRVGERRLIVRRSNPVEDPGPPAGDERRVAERRKGRRRTSDVDPFEW